MKRLVILLLIIFLLCPAAASAAKRVALVIGNSAYKSSPLKNPVNDAKDVTAILRKLGFQVTLLTNANKSKMISAVRDFANTGVKADVRLFYYAGHGYQLRNNNYIIPVGTNISDEFEVESEALAIRRILSAMSKAKTGANVVILDACRNNPFASDFRSTSRGLARMESPTGTLIAYATKPGGVAADGSGRNGVFTKYLIKYMGTSGLDLEDVFRNVRKSVFRATNGKQVPWSESSIMDPLYFAGNNRKEVQKRKPLQVASAAKPKAKPKAVQVINHSKVWFPPKAKGRLGQVWTDPTTRMKFVWVPGGSYMMGSNDSKYQSPVHRVSLKGFWIGKYEVTQNEWKRVMGSNPATFKDKRKPVESISWNDVQRFISKLNSMGSAKFALPSEAQWEYAARSGGKDEKYSGSNYVDQVAWYRSNSRGGSYRVGTKAANGLGIHDMSGNVWEWCADKGNFNYYGAPSNGSAWTTGDSKDRVLRGGSFSSGKKDILTVRRWWSYPDSGANYIGFRLYRIK